MANDNKSMTKRLLTSDNQVPEANFLTYKMAIRCRRPT